MKIKRIVVGLSGASGAPIAVKLLEALAQAPGVESHLVISKGGQTTLEHETGMGLQEIKSLAGVFYENDDMGAAISSGTFRTDGMVIAPCSMKTAGGIASGYSDNLLLRAADVTLKERRKLVIVARECPLSSIHLRNLLELSNAGAVIMPPVVAYYNNPSSVEEITGHIVGKILDCFGLEYTGLKRWKEK